MILIRLLPFALGNPHPDRRREPASARSQRQADGRGRCRAVSDLISLIRESVDKLARDQTSRGDLKILSRTLRELATPSRSFRPIDRGGR